MQFFPIFQTIDPIIAALPLLIVIAGTMLKDGYEDLKRHVSDRQINNRMCVEVRPVDRNVVEMPPLPKALPKFLQKYKKPKVIPIGRTYCFPIPWKDIKVGMLVLVSEDEPFPADLVLIGSSDPDGLCFIETKNLDGETNLKVHKAPQEIQGMLSVNNLSDSSNLMIEIECDQPQVNLNAFKGLLKVSSHGSTEAPTQTPLAIENMLLRGCFLRNTEWVLGIVCYTGEDTKIRLNSGATPLKRSILESKLNGYVLLNLFFLAVSCLFVTLGAYIDTKEKASTFPSWMDFTFSPSTDNYTLFALSSLWYCT